MPDSEKGDIVNKESPSLAPVHHEKTIQDPDADLSEGERLEALCLLYLLAFLDRTNIGNAKVAHLDSDLGLSSPQYNLSLTIFFISYSVFEPLTNILLKRLRPSIFIPIIMILWGASMLSMGFVKDYGGLMAARWFLGLTEAGLFPGVNYYLSCWYKRSEFGIRAAIFFSAAAISGSFGGLLAAVLAKMDGLGGLAGWSWIFILEGLLTVIIGVASFWAVHDFPDEAKFLSPRERARVVYRLSQDRQASANSEKFQTVYLFASLRDWKMWLGMIVYMGCVMPLYGFSLFLPSIVNDLGWNTSPVRSQLMTVPPYVVGCIFTILIGWLADHTKQRGVWNILCSFVGMAGFSMLLGSRSAGVKYAGTFLGALGIYPCISNTITWMANNTEGVYKRGVVLGFVLGWGNLNGVVSSNIYFDGPEFTAGHAVMIGYMGGALCVGSVLMRFLLQRENRAREHGERDWRLEDFDKVDQLGDQHPSFRYTL